MKVEFEGIWLRSHWGGCLAWVVVISLIVFAISSCEGPTRYEHVGYQEGTIVCMVLTGDKAQVTKANRSQSGIYVRIAEMSSISGDGVTVTSREYKQIYVYEYEVDNCK